MLGPPGVGKTHLAISLAIAAAEYGRRVYYGTLADLITSLEEAEAAGRLQQRLKILTHPALLVVDEIGYLPITRTGAMHFFQLMTRRYEHASTVLTSNKSFEEWGEVFGDEVMAAALIDRLLHHCHIVNIRGNSFDPEHSELWQALHTPAQEEISHLNRTGALVRKDRRPEGSSPTGMGHFRSPFLGHFRSPLTARKAERQPSQGCGCVPGAVVVGNDPERVSVDLGHQVLLRPRRSASLSSR